MLSGPLLAAASEQKAAPLWLQIVLLAVFAVVIYVVLRVLRPRLREQRFERWRREGLLDDEPRDGDPGDDDRRRD